MVYLFGQDISTPSDLLQNEWAPFIGIFLLTFAIVYFSVAKFFSTKKQAGLEDLLRGKGDKLVVHPAALIISVVIAFFTASSISQYGPFYTYFAGILGAWILLFVLILMFILSLVFLKMFKHFFGNNSLGGFISGIGIAIVYWFFLKHYLVQDFIYNYSSTWADSAYAFLSSGGGLVVMIILFGVVGLFIKTERTARP